MLPHPVNKFINFCSLLTLEKIELNYILHDERYWISTF